MSKISTCPICQNTILPDKLEVDEEILSWLNQLRETKALQSWLFYCKTIHGQAMRGTTAQIVAENIGVFQKQFVTEIQCMQEQQRKLKDDMQKQQIQSKEEMRKLIDENLSRQREITSKELTQFSEVLNKIASGLTERASAIERYQMHFKDEIRNLIDKNLSKQRETTSKELTQFSEVLNKISSGLTERTSAIDEHIRKQTTVTSTQMTQFSETLNKIASGAAERTSTSLNEMAITFSTNMSKVQNDMLMNFTDKFGEISTRLTHILTDLARQPLVKKAEIKERELVEELCEACEKDYIERVGGAGKPDIVAKPKHEGVEIGRTVVFEVKDTQRWSNKFIDQLKKYMENYHTPFGILATKDLPAESEIKGFSVSVDRYGIMLICKYEYGALAYQMLRKLLIALYLEGKETMDFQALFKDEEILGLLEETKGYTKYIRSIRKNVRDIEKDLSRMQDELDKKLDAVTYKIATLQKS
ncbi:MAG: DUF2130 domain-containing protein [Candidatus Bathyarchaeota archaeon]|nr:DUF2130 domain-containing protein [Candidatus Bathyarchaeota archaeon]